MMQIAALCLRIILGVSFQLLNCLEFLSGCAPNYDHLSLCINSLLIE